MGSVFNLPPGSVLYVAHSLGVLQISKGHFDGSSFLSPRQNTNYKENLAQVDQESQVNLHQKQTAFDTLA